ncbi:hypothetical protein D3C80_1088390 [compost metagenome]
MSAGQGHLGRAQFQLLIEHVERGAQTDLGLLTHALGGDRGGADGLLASQQRRLGGDGLGIGRADALQHAATLALDGDLGGVGAFQRLGHPRPRQAAGEQRHRNRGAGGEGRAIRQIKARQIVGRAAIRGRQARRRQIFRPRRRHIGLGGLQGIARSQHARILDQGHIQGGVEIIR